MAATKLSNLREKYREEARSKIKAVECIDKILNNINILETTGAKEEGLSSNQIGAIKGANEARFNLLKKILPDLKQTEITGDNGKDIQIVLQQAHNDI